ncbi:MAG: TIGR03546 family protein [Pirellulales bacterium]
MLSSTIAPFRKTVRALLAFNSLGQLAAGFVLGMIVGLVPKGNLIALSLCVLLFSLRCNKGLALVAAVLFSCIATWTDPIAHKIGLAALGAESMQAAYASVINLPLGPWLEFNNTVVTGSLLLGLYLCYPVYWSVRAMCGLLQNLTRSSWHRTAPQPGGAA